MTESKTQIEVKESTDLEATNQLKEILRGNIDVSEFRAVDEDPAAVQRRIVEQYLNATDEDELENTAAATPWQQLLGVPVEIHSWRWRPSEIEGNGSPVYVIVDVTDTINGNSYTVTCGAYGVIAQMIKLQEMGKIPGAVRRLVEGGQTKAGYRPLSLVSTERELAERAEAKAKEHS